MTTSSTAKWRFQQINTQRIIDINQTSTVGRNDKAKICLRSNKASRIHATIIVNVEGNLLVQDLKSINGTFVNGTQISVSNLHRIFPGDIISFGVATMDMAEDNRDKQCFYKVILEEQPPAKEIINGSIADSTTEIDKNGINESGDVIEISSSTNDNPEVDHLTEVKIAKAFPIIEDKPLNAKRARNSGNLNKKSTVQEKPTVGSSNCSLNDFQSAQKRHSSKILNRRETIHIVDSHLNQSAEKNVACSNLRLSTLGGEKGIIKATSSNDFGELILQANNLASSSNNENVEQIQKTAKVNKSSLNKNNNKTDKKFQKNKQAIASKEVTVNCEEANLRNKNIPCTSGQNNSNKKFTIDNDNSIIIDITDDNDDMDFSCSQIFQMSQVVKTENEDDIYNKIKNELAEMDFCNDEIVLNTVPINLENDFENSGFENTQDICEFLQDGIDAGTNVNNMSTPNSLHVSTGLSCIENEDSSGSSEVRIIENESSNLHKTPMASERRLSVKPPIIEPHSLTKPVKKIRQTPRKIDKSDKGTSHKRKSSLEAPSVKKKIKSNQKSPLNSTNYKSKEIALEFNRRRRSSSIDMDKAEKLSILEERRKKLKQLADISKPEDSVTKLNSSVSKVISAASGDLLNDNIEPIEIAGAVNSYKKLKSVDLPLIPTTYNLRRAKSSDELKVRKQTVNKDRACPVTRHSTGLRIQPSSSSTSVDQLMNRCIDPPRDQLYNKPYYPKMTLLEMRDPPNKNGLLGKTPVSRRLANVDDITKTVVQWLPHWLQEQVSMDYSPPVNRPPAKKITTNFRNFTDYYNTFSKLVLLENWQYLYKAFRESTEQPRKVKIEHVRIANDVMVVDCVCYITRQELRQGLFYKPEDVVLFECVINDQNNCYGSLNFGFVENCRKTVIPNDALISVQRDLCPGDPHAMLEFTMRTRYQPEKEIYTRRPCIVKLLANIRGHLMLIRAIKGLEQSPLCSMIMKPEMNDYKFPITHRNIIHPHGLNLEQKTIVLEAASLCTGKKHGIYCVKGPPGTGKSTVIVNLIFQILFSYKKHGTGSGKPPMILLAAPSNTAVDSLISKLVELKHRLVQELKHQVKLVRIGPESSISKDVIGYSLPKLAEQHVPWKNIEIPQIKAAKERNENMVEFSKNFFKDQYSHELRMCENLVISKSNIICTTLNSCINGRLIDAVNRGLLEFTCCIIDEATQCHEAEALLPTILGIDKFVIVGDPQQLNATIMSRDASKLGFDQSLFSRLANNFGHDPRSPIKMLTNQYRMHPEICEFPNKQFYEGKLRSFAKFSNKLPDKIRPYLVFNCEKVTQSKDYTNIDEICLIKKLLSTIFSMINRDQRYTVGIITPYNAQKDLICSSIVDLIAENENVKITTNTVDSFQGSEFDIVIISCVRDSSNSFLQNENRLNVALTRAKQALYIIGNYTLFKECRPLYDLRENAKRRKVLLDIKQNPRSIRNFNKFLIQQKSPFTY